MTPTDPKKLAKDPPEAHHSTQRHLEGAHERNGGFPWIYSVLKPVNFPFDVLDDWLRGSTFFFVFNPSVAVVSVSWRTGNTAVVKSPLFNPKTLKRGCPLWWNLEIGWQHRSEEVPNLYVDGHPTIQQHHPTASFWLKKSGGYELDINSRFQPFVSFANRILGWSGAGAWHFRRPWVDFGAETLQGHRRNLKGPWPRMAAMPLSSWQELRLNLWFMVNMISPFNKIFICRIL